MLRLLFSNGNVMAWHGNDTNNTTCANSTLLTTAQPVQKPV